jgi:CubicO group peptidase (beta-lactamase class C family)
MRKPRSFVAAVFAAIALAACGGSDAASPPPPPSPGPDASDAGPPDSAAPGDAGANDGSVPAVDFAALIDPIIEAARAKETTKPDLAFSLYDKDDRLLYTKAYGDFARDRRVAIASSSKMVSGLVLLRLVSQGVLSLDTTTGTALGWTGDNGTITLRHLMSFTSGLKPDATCLTNASMTMAACVDIIAAEAMVALPGVRYDYGNTHLSVAGRMAEVVTGKSWATLFGEQVKEPLGLGASADLAYFAAPRQVKGPDNPLPAGGLRATMDEYAQILGSIFHGPTGKAPLPADLAQAQTVEPFPNVVVGNSPLGKMGLPDRYGLAAWLECSTPATGCARISSPGAFGFTPWLDRDKGYYAILGMQLGSSGTGAVPFSVHIERDLQPVIEKALGR